MTVRERLADVLIQTVAPLVLACVATAIVVGALGADPLAFAVDVVRFGLEGQGWQQTLTTMAPLLLVGLGLIVAFRAQLWNLGAAGTFVLGAAVIAGIAPDLLGAGVTSAPVALPYPVAILTLCVVAMGVGAVVALVPALLKARRGVTEIVTTLMLSFVAVGIANLLVKGPLRDTATTQPQTRVLPLEVMLPFVPGTRVHVGVVLALVIVVVGHIVLTRSSLGMKIDVLGAQPRAAAHAGLPVGRLIITIMLISGGLIGLAGAIDVLGVWGVTRADWNPGYGDTVLPFVFLARLNPAGSVPLIGLVSVLSTGGSLAAQRAGLSVDVLLVVVGFVVFFMVLIEALGRRRPWGRSYLTRGVVR